MEFYKYTLPNGIRCIHKRTRSAVTHCALTINVGSRDEHNSEFGVAHFAEHLIFKGTERRKAYHINSRLERLGGELNAFTTKEETVVHTTTLNRDLAKSAELISDIVFNSVFPAKEVEKEREIILDEINSYKDSPAERIYDDFEDLIFAKSELGHNILGNKKSVRSLSSEQIKEFTKKMYCTDRMIFSVIGNVSETQFRRVVELYFGDLPLTTNTLTRSTPAKYNAIEKTCNYNTHQTHCLIGNRAYSLKDSNRVALALLTNIIGGPAANSLLNMTVREKYGLTYNIESSYTPFVDTGLFSIYFSSDYDNTNMCIDLINKLLHYITASKFSDRQLSAFKKQFIGQMTIGLENNESYMLSAAKSYLVYDDIDSNKVIYDKIKNISADDILSVANEVFTNMSILTFK